MGSCKLNHRQKIEIWSKTEKDRKSSWCNSKRFNRILVSSNTIRILWIVSLRTETSMYGSVRNFNHIPHSFLLRAGNFSSTWRWKENLKTVRFGQYDESICETGKHSSTLSAKQINYTDVCVHFHIAILYCVVSRFTLRKVWHCLFHFLFALLSSEKKCGTRLLLYRENLAFSQISAAMAVLYFILLCFHIWFTVPNEIFG